MKLILILIAVLALLAMAPGCPPTPVDTEPPPQETEPVETPEETEEPQETPEETEPVETVETEQPGETPETTEPASTEVVTTQSVDETPEPEWPVFVDDGKEFKDAALPKSGFGPQEQARADAEAALAGGILGAGILVMIGYATICLVFGKKSN